ncbi:MAG: helix-turn-helix domain-containing protein, partial [Verrucomicrobiota bacterium]
LIAPENLLLTPSMASGGAMHPAPSAEHSDAGGPPLDPPVSARLATAPVPVSPTPAPLHADTEGQRKSLADLEREHILRVLEMTGWNRAEAADILEVTTRTLRNKLRQYREMGIIATDD